MKHNCKQAYVEAIKVVQKCAHPVGIKASARISGYPQVWARDTMITLLGASFINDKSILRTFKASFRILRQKQSSTGAIPNNVDVKSHRPNFQAYADSGLWFVIGNSIFFKQTGDKTFLKENYPAIKRVLQWYEYQDVDCTGLITIAEGSDWEDLLAVRGKGLYVNVIHYLALLNASSMAASLGYSEAKKYKKKAKMLREKINYYFWCRGDHDPLPHIKFSFGVQNYFKGMGGLFGRKNHALYKSALPHSSYYLPYLTFRDFGEWFDSFGNMLSILSGIANEKQAKTLLALMKKFRVAKPYPIKAIYPSIRPKQKDWRDYYKVGRLNLPDQYHNGGIWPFLGGFYVAVLVKMKKYDEAHKALEMLASLNKKGKGRMKWGFNEWFHGKTGKPMGNTQQAWSAGMYIYAYEAVRTKKAMFF